MELIVRIGTDPTSWAVAEPSYASIVEQLGQASAPVVLMVTAPLDGRLVLSHRAAGSVAVIQPPGGRVWETHEWNPGHGAAPTAPLVYLAAPADSGQGPGFAVSSNVDTATVVEEIASAMKEGTMLTLQVYDASGTGALVINGAALPFAVVC